MSITKSGSRARLVGLLVVMAAAGAFVKPGSAVSVGVTVLLLALTALGLYVAVASHRRPVAVAAYALTLISMVCEAYRELNAARFGVDPSLAVVAGLLLIAGGLCVVVDILMSRKQLRQGTQRT